MRLFYQAALASGLTVGLAFSAMAHPELKSSEPQANAMVSSPTKIELNFTEDLATKFSGAKLTMTGMKGMSSHSPMAVAAKVSPGSNPKSMVVTPENHYLQEHTVLTGGRYPPIHTLLPEITPSL